MNRTRIARLLVAAAVVAAALWLYLGRGHGTRATVPIQDAKTIDFSNGSPVVKDDPASRDRMQKALSQIDDATRGMSVSGAPASPTPSPSR